MPVRFAVRLAVLIVLALAARPLQASLIFATPNETSGTGLGAVNTLLTVQNDPSGTTESGCVAWNGSMDIVGPAACPPGIAGGDEVGINETKTIGSLGLASAFNLRVVFNASEDAGRMITLENMILRIYAPDGTVLFSSEPFTPVTLTSAFRGTGTSGFVFRLDAEQAAEANAHFSDPNNRVGLSASATGAEGGSETFYIADAAAVVPAAIDLSVIKTDSPDPVVVGETLTYTLLVNNAGPNTATSVTVTDTLPAGVTFNSATASQGSCSQAGGIVTCDLGAIGGGSSATITISVTPTAAGTITNTALVEAPETDVNPTDNTTTEDTEVVAAAPPRADLSVIKTDSPDPVAVGGALTYTIQVTNAGPDAATGVIVTDTLPSSVTFNSTTETQGSCTQSGRTVRCDLGSLASGATATITINVTPNADAVITDIVTVTANENDPVPSNNTDSEETVVGVGAAEQADVFTVKTDAPDPVAVGEALTYSIRVTNNGPDAATGVTVSDTLPGSVTYVSSSSTQGTCTFGGGVVTCDVGTLAVGTSALVSITVTPGSAGVITDTATATANESDPNPANNASSEDTTVVAAVPPRADLSVVKTDSPDPVSVGNALVYTLTVSNAGPDAATGVTLVDTLPTSVTFNGATPSQGTGCSLSGRVVTCDLGNIASGATAAVTISVTPTVAGTIVNNVAVSGNEADADTTNNNDAESTQVGPAPSAGADLGVTKTDSADPVPVGVPFTYSITVTNAGPNPATGVQVSDTLPGGVTFNSATPSQGTCAAPAAGVVNCDLGTIASGAGATVVISVTPTMAGTVVNTVGVGGNEIDPAPGNNQDTESTVIGTVPPPAPIPTLSQWMLLVFALIIGVAGAFRFRA